MSTHTNDGTDSTNNLHVKLQKAKQDLVMAESMGAYLDVMRIKEFISEIQLEINREEE